MAMRLRARSSPMWVQRMFRFTSTNKNRVWRHLFPPRSAGQIFHHSFVTFNHKYFSPMGLGAFPYSPFGGLHRVMPPREPAS